MRLCGPGGTNMQGQRELGGAPGQMPPLRRFPSDLTEQAGGVSLCPLSKDSDASEAPGKQSGGAADLLAQAASSPRVSGHHEGLSTCTLSGPEPGEHPGAWGEFEGFQESSARSEQFSQSFELPERPTEPQLPRTASAQRERGSPQPHQGGPAWTEATAIAPAEVFLKGSSSRCCTGSASHTQAVVAWPGRGPASLWAFVPGRVAGRPLLPSQEKMRLQTWTVPGGGSGAGRLLCPPPRSRHICPLYFPSLASAFPSARSPSTRLCSPGLAPVRAHGQRGISLSSYLESLTRGHISVCVQRLGWRWPGVQDSVPADPSLCEYRHHTQAASPSQPGLPRPRSPPTCQHFPPTHKPQTSGLRGRFHGGDHRGDGTGVLSGVPLSPTRPPALLPASCPVQQFLGTNKLCFSSSNGV